MKRIYTNKYFYPLIGNPFSNKDISEGIKALKSKQITISTKTAQFEKIFTKTIKTNYSLMVNSGSSANLLAFQCLVNPYRKKRLNKGDEVIIPTLAWSTSLWPIVQSNLKPVFVDINPNTLNIDESQIEKKINNKTKAILLVHVLGNSCNMDIILKLKKKYKLIVIEDTCESLGSKFKGEYLGTFGDFSSFSFYTSHQISSGEGGMISCKDRNDYNIIKSLRSHGWSRGTDFENTLSKQYKNLDKRFIFFNSGYNLRPTEISAAIGLNQFKRINNLIKIRDVNRKKIIKAVRKNNFLNGKIDFYKENTNIKASWFGLSIKICDKRKNIKKRILKKLDMLGVETRPIISGNFVKQPGPKKYKLSSKEKFPMTDKMYDTSFFIGLPTKKMSLKLLTRLVSSLEKSFK